MINKIIKLGAIIGLACSIFSAKADLYTTTNSNNGLRTGGAFIMISNDCVITGIQVSSDDANTLRFFDNSGTYGYTNYVWGVYTNWSSYATNQTVTYVTSTGLTNYYTNIGIYSYAVSVPAGSNTLPVLYQVALPASTVGSMVNVSIPISQGVAVFQSGSNATVTVRYRPLY